MAGHTNERSGVTPPRALLDTTVQLDRVKFQSRKVTIEALLSNYQFKFATSLSLVEFKATIIQECITIHNQLRAKGATFTRARDILLEKDHRQRGLRMHIFNNYLSVFGRSSFDVSQKEDAVLAEKARLALENIIPELFHWFSSDDTVDMVLKDKLKCDRAREAPSKLKAAFAVNLPECRRGKNKTCHVEKLIRAESPSLIKKLVPLLQQALDAPKKPGDDDKQKSQLQKAVDLFEEVIKNPSLELSVNDCRKAGDCLIAIEAGDSATHALSSNAREWKPISEASGYEFVHVDFSDEKTRS